MHEKYKQVGVTVHESSGIRLGHNVEHDALLFCCIIYTDLLIHVFLIALQTWTPN